MESLNPTADPLKLPSSIVCRVQITSFDIDELHEKMSSCPGHTPTPLRGVVCVSTTASTYNSVIINLYVLLTVT